MNSSQHHFGSRQIATNQCPQLPVSHGYHPSHRSAQLGGTTQPTLHSRTYCAPKPQPLPPPPSSSEANSNNAAATIMGSAPEVGASSSEVMTVVTFFVCEVCASRYRSTAGLRYHYHSQHVGYTPRNPISASASRVTIPMHEFNRLGPTTGLRGGRNSRSKRNRVGSKCFCLRINTLLYSHLCSLLEPDDFNFFISRLIICSNVGTTLRMVPHLSWLNLINLGQKWIFRNHFTLHCLTYLNNDSYAEGWDG